MSSRPWSPYDNLTVRRLLAILALGLLCPAASSARLQEGALEAARKQALAEGKYLYVAFLGEGWSVSCKRFQEKVLDDPLFKQFARDHLVYFPVQARRKPPLSKEETAVLQSWVIHFDIKAYPTLILIAPDGNELLRHGYKDLDGPDYVDLLRNLLPPSGN